MPQPILDPSMALIVSLVGPLAVGAVIVLLGKRPNLRDGAGVVGAAGVFATVALGLLPAVRAGGRPEWTVLELLGDLAIAFRVEPLGVLFAMVASGLWIVTSIYAVGYLRGHHETHQTRFFLCFALAIFGALGVAYSANLLTLFLFYELITLSTYPLVTHRGDVAAKRAGRVYLGLLMSTSIAFLLLAIAWTYSLTGTLDFRDGGILSSVDPSLLTPLLALF
ncbi:MAG: proton-conducting transporter membrane subunit, partial [Acidobacteriota bacterium]